MPLVLGLPLRPRDDARPDRAPPATFTVGAITVFTALMQRRRRGHRLLVAARRSTAAARRRAGDRGAVRGATGALHPQHLRADRDDVAVARRAVRRARPWTTRRGALSGRRADVRHDVRILDKDGHAGARGRGRRDRHRAARRSSPGYWEKPEETEQRDPGGRAAHRRRRGHGRQGRSRPRRPLKDQINVSGYKVWPREVEDMLAEHDCRPRGGGHRHRRQLPRRDGTRVRHPASGRRRPSPSGLQAFCNERMAAYKYPRPWRSSTSCRRRPRARCCDASCAIASRPRPDRRRPGSR